jgi:excisionase family DNA binding protein
MVNSTSENFSLIGSVTALKWITTKQASIFLGISENALRIMVYRRQIKFYKFGRRLRFLQDDLKLLFTQKE